MFGLGDKALAMIGGGASLVLAIALAYVWISSSAEISSLKDAIHDPETGYAVRLERAQSDLTQCRANRITLEEATRRQNEAVAAAKAESAGRIANLERAADQADADAARARREADRILARQGTGDVCADADALIMEEIGQ